MGEVAPVSVVRWLWISLVSSRSVLLATSSAGASAVQVATNAPTTGTYTVIVGTNDGFGRNEDTGSYLLTLAKGPGAFVTSAGDEGGDLTNGATQAGTIYLGDLDQWSFTATQGDYIALSMGEVAPVSAGFRPRSLLDALPILLLATSSAGASAVQVATNAPTTGTYTVIVGTNDGFGRNEDTGSYLLTLAKGPGAFATSTGDEGGPLTNGATQAGTIYLGDLDQWSFTATQGDYIALSMGEVAPVSAGFRPWIRLVSPTGVLLATSSAGASAVQVATNAPTTGTYTVIVGTNDGFGRNEDTGSYLLTLAKGPGAFATSSGDEGGALTNGATQAGTIYLGDLDQWSFTATQGDYLALSLPEVAPVSGGFQPWIRLVSPTGVLLGNSIGASAVQIAATAPTTGTYTVIVGTNDGFGRNNDAGSYLLTLAKGPGAFETSTGDEGGALTNGATQAGTIYLGDLDQWSFTATQGDYIALSMGEVAPVTAGFQPWIRLVSPTGVLLGNSIGASAAQITVTAPTTGAYTVIVGTNDGFGRNNDTGSYQLTLTR